MTAESCLSRLARLFPEVTAVRLPIRVAVVGREDADSAQATTIEFGTHNEVLFACDLALEVGDRLQIANSNRSLDTEAVVVAVQYHAGRKAVAARFVRAVPTWIVQP